jgi:hypothetical protein
MREGWKCPVCGRGVSPDHGTCDHGGQAALPDPSYAQPYRPLEFVPFPGTAPGYMPGCGCKVGDVCMNAACPNRMVVTCATSTGASGNA